MTHHKLKILLGYVCALLVTLGALPIHAQNATPIANPGQASIEAVLNPEDTNFLFFVANGTGGHIFAETLNQHNANVKKWRAIEAGKAKK